MTSPSTSVDSILGPIELDEFTEVYFERQPLHVSGRDAGHFHGLLNIGSIERLLASAALYYPSTQLTNSARPVPVDDYTDAESRIIAKRLIQHHADGATIVISQAHRQLVRLSEVCRAVQSRLKVRCQTNVYLTPPGSQGFNPHYDSHDVFILQVEGCKIFRFHGGGPELPLSHHRYEPGLWPCGALSEEVLLRPGDTLYIPRGVMHDAIASGEAASLHVTLGIFPLTVYDLLQATLADAALDNVAVRRSAASLQWQAGQTESGLPAGLDQQLLNEVFTQENLRRAASSLADELAIDVVPDCQSLLSSASPQPQLSLDSHVELREGIVLDVTAGTASLKLRTHGQVLEFAEPLNHGVESLLSVPCQRIGDLPGLNDEQRIALCTRLLHERVIRLNTGNEIRTGQRSERS